MIGIRGTAQHYPKGYRCNSKVPIAVREFGLRKNHMAFYLMCCYGDPKLKAWKEQGKKFYMGGFRAVQEA